ncbi:MULTISPECIES: FecR family protein [Serratia]|uniref:FecR family protein n=1 Tax=Serratia TaxID=613 RepID=UPI00313C19AF
MNPLTAQSRQQAAAWAVRLAEGALAADQRRALEAWLADDPQHPAALRQARLLWATLGQLPPEQRQALQPQVAALKTPFRRRGARWAMAAAVAIAVSFGVYRGPDIWIGMQADYQTVRGEVREVTLPDGSRVALDSGSAIALAYSANERKVRLLSGAAYFIVAPVNGPEKRPFRVEAENGVTQALGTEFSVARTGQGVDVSVHQHSVRVTLERGERSLVVAQRQAAHYRSGLLWLTRQTAGDDAWRRGWLVIDRQPLTQALAQLNRYRETRIVAINPELRSRTVSGVFALNKLDDGVSAIRQELAARQLNLPGITLLY